MQLTPHATWLKRLPPTLFKLGSQAWIDYKFPRHLFVETTSSCNLACAYCPREQRRDHMDWRLFCDIVTEATSFGPRSFSLHLFGEPTLYPRWTDAIRFIRRAHPKHTILLTTNGTTLNARVDDLIACNPNLVLWTWRPEAQFTPQTKEKLRRWGKFRVRFIDEVTPPEARNEWADWPNVEGRTLHNFGGDIDTSRWSTTRSSTPSGSAAKTARRWPCYHLWLAPAVAWNGNILLCCADPHQKEVLGKVPDQTVAEAWQGERIKAIRNGHLQGNYRGICANCDVWKIVPDLFFKWQQRSSS